MRILLVDGDADLLQRIRRAFGKSHRGWEVILAHTGSEALQVLSRDQVDIVILDLRLPDLEGAELIHRVRELQPGAVRIALAEHILPCPKLQNRGHAEQAGVCGGLQTRENVGRIAVAVLFAQIERRIAGDPLLRDAHAAAPPCCS
jgi:CheY-like chemotaxis protein